jgi:hypothetical protein
MMHVSALVDLVRSSFIAESDPFYSFVFLASTVLFFPPTQEKIPFLGAQSDLQNFTFSTLPFSLPFGGGNHDTWAKLPAFLCFLVQSTAAVAWKQYMDKSTLVETRLIMQNNKRVATSTIVQPPCLLFSFTT